MKDCLVVVDAQNGFVKDQNADWLKKLECLMKANLFHCVVATQFYNTKGSSYDRMLHWDGLLSWKSQELLPLVKESVSKVFWKNGYTCFTPEFTRFVEEQCIQRLFFTGVDLDCCVLKSAIDSFERGIECCVVVDCCSSNGGPESEEAAIKVLSRTIGESRLVQGRQLFCNWSRLGG